MLVLIRGAGDLASGVGYLLKTCGFQVIMTDLPRPTAIRRTVAFSPAITDGTAVVEGVTGRRAADPGEARQIAAGPEIAVLADPELNCLGELRPDVLIDAILAKKNLGTRLGDAPFVIALGPGFIAGQDCHCVIETKRGHWLGRPIYDGPASPNTGVPGNIGGFTAERIIRSPKAGLFRPLASIGDLDEAGQPVASVDDTPVTAPITGVLRGILPADTPVFAGMKSGDVDPRAQRDYCFTISDKARAIAGGVLAAIIANSGVIR